MNPTVNPIIPIISLKESSKSIQFENQEMDIEIERFWLIWNGFVAKSG